MLTFDDIRVGSIVYSTSKKKVGMVVFIGLKKDYCCKCKRKDTCGAFYMDLDQLRFVISGSDCTCAYPQKLKLICY